MRAKVLIISAFVFVLFLPLLVRAVWGGGNGAGSRDGGHSRPDGAGASSAAQSGPTGSVRRLVVVTPHVEQIREEFGDAFARWHLRTHQQPVEIDWRTPGGTSDIMKALEAQFEAAAAAGRIDDNGAAQPGAIGYDVFFGGGSFEHSKMKDKRTSFRSINGQRTKVDYRWGRPAGFDPKELEALYGENKIGIQQLYDPDQFWLGAALSGFGIVYNRQVLNDLGLSEPQGFGDLCDPRYMGLLSLADARQSGSVTTTLDAILNKEGWERGWRILREMSGNARSFASASTKPPVDVSQGDAAAGLAIDFYGRGQSQFVLRAGQKPDDSRVGYVDPKGATYIDADPVSIINGAADFELAQRFVQFLLRTETQALWQFPSKIDPKSANNPAGDDGEKMGPRVYELRRMPVRRLLYDKYAAHMIDPANPFDIAADVPARNFRSAIGPLMAAFGIDTGAECREAWRALNAARKAASADEGAGGRFPRETLDEMERLFYAMPEHTMQPGTIWWPTDLTKGLSKDATRELEKQKIATFDALDKAIDRAGKDGKTPKEIVEEWKKLAAVERPAPGAEPVRLTLSEQTFRAIRNDTDSWKNPSHGKRTLIAYTEFFRASYWRVVEMHEQQRDGKGIGARSAQARATITRSADRLAESARP